MTLLKYLVISWFTLTALMGFQLLLLAADLVTVLVVLTPLIVIGAMMTWVLHEARQAHRARHLDQHRNR